MFKGKAQNQRQQNSENINRKTGQKTHNKPGVWK